MAKTIDLTNQKIGKWTVLKIDKEIKSKQGTYWVCQCECGTIKSVRSSALRNGQSNSCGKCKEKKEKIKKEKLNLIGQKFGKWFVIEKDIENSKSHYGSYWKCRCECGKISSIRGTVLTSKKSSGCLSCSIKRTHIKDEVGNKYGLLTVLELDEEKTDNYKWSNNKHNAFWKCQCDCGNICSILGIYLRNGDVKSCGCLGKSFGEHKIESILKENNISFIRDKKYFTDLIISNGGIGRYDFILLDENQKPYRLIEFDGEQHFKETNYFTRTLEENQKDDALKNQYALQHNLPLVRIPYWEVNNITFEMLFGDTFEIK